MSGFRYWIWSRKLDSDFDCP